MQLLNNLRIVSQIDLSADDEAGYSRTMMPNFRKPFLLNVLERSGRGDAEANQENVRLWLRERTQTIVIFLPYLFHVTGIS